MGLEILKCRLHESFQMFEGVERESSADRARLPSRCHLPLQKVFCVAKVLIQRIRVTRQETNAYVSGQAKYEGNDERAVGGRGGQERPESSL